MGERSASLASLELSGVFATSADALRRRLVGPWAIGLRQYLALRLKDGRRATDAFSELRRLVSATPTSELVREPGAKAHVYRLARELAAEHAARIPGAGRLTYRTPPEDAPRDYGEALARLRNGLSPDDAELLELRHARELSPVELACVFDAPLDTIEERLRAATARARDWLGPHAPEPGSALRPLVDAFALAPTRTESAGVRGDDTKALPAGTRVGGRYSIVERVGIGAFGDVYKAVDEDVPGHRVALKVLREPSLSTAAREAALRELKLIASVFHPSVVNFKDHGWHEDRLWFVMPWYEGETLEQRMSRGPLSRAEARRIFEPLARALATLHANGIRHQDIKPDNVLLAVIKGLEDEGGAPRVLPVLLDLGVAAQDNEGLIGGTPVYFAPEVAAHYANVDDPEDGRVVGPKADVFALALSLRNALEPESEEDVPAGAIEAFIQRRATQVPPLPRSRDLRFLSPWLSRWLSLDPDARPTAEELARELAVLTRPEEQRQRVRGTLSWLAPAVLALCAVFGALVYVFEREREMQQRAIDEARTEAAQARADLVIEESRRQALSQDHEALLAQYEESRLSRDELASRLATAEGQIQILGDRLAGVMSERDGMTEELESARVRVAQAEGATTGLRRALEAQTERARVLGVELEDARAAARRDLADLRDEVSDARSRASELERELERAEAARDSAEQSAEEIAGRLAIAEEHRLRTEEQMEALRTRVAEMRRLLLSPGSSLETSEGGGESEVDRLDTLDAPTEPQLGEPL